MAPRKKFCKGDDFILTKFCLQSRTNKSEDMKMKATYSKMKLTGEWGIRVEDGSVTSGDLVQVTKKNGTVQTEMVKAVVWTGDNIQLCEIEKKGPRS